MIEDRRGLRALLKRDVSKIIIIIIIIKKIILPYVWKYNVDIVLENRDQVGGDEGAGGPDDQKHWQEAQSLHEPEHLWEVF